MDQNTAKLIKRVKTRKTGITQNLYKMSPYYQGNEYVVLSQSNVMFSGWETYIFPSDQEGNILDWGEMEGSSRGLYNDSEILTGIGYKRITP